MQDQSIYSQIKPQFPEQEHLKCPRCDSPNTKFCYYNNYNLSQPRHYCKSCRRYWTKGGTLRNIPVGGGSRKATKRSASSNNLNNNNNNNNNKRAATTTTSCSVTTATLPVTSSGPKPEPFGIPPTTIDVSGPFSSLLASNGPQFGNLLEVLNANNGSSLQLGDLSSNLNSNSGLGSGPGSGSGSDGIPPKVNNMDGYMADSNCWNGNNGWPDLAIYTPGSTFQ